MRLSSTKRTSHSPSSSLPAPTVNRRSTRCKARLLARPKIRASSSLLFPPKKAMCASYGVAAIWSLGPSARSTTHTLAAISSVSGFGPRRTECWTSSAEASAHVVSSVVPHHSPAVALRSALPCIRHLWASVPGPAAHGQQAHFQFLTCRRLPLCSNTAFDAEQRPVHFGRPHHHFTLHHHSPQVAKLVPIGLIDLLPPPPPPRIATVPLRTCIQPDSSFPAERDSCGHSVTTPCSTVHLRKLLSWRRAGEDGAQVGAAM